MKETRVAQRYAKSLISLAEERQVLDQVKEDMVIIKSVCEENRDFNNMQKVLLLKQTKKAQSSRKFLQKNFPNLALSFLISLLKRSVRLL